MLAGRREQQFIEDDRGALTASYGPFLLKSAFQPIFSQADDGLLTIEAFEALIRPQRAGQPVSPAEFFARVEPGDGLAVDTLCRELHILNMGRIGRRSARLFVNFNPGLFRTREDIAREAERLVDVTGRAGLRPGRIVCEITEQAGGNDAALAGLVQRLRASLFKIAVDDYGAEDSDINRVERLKPDVIKFDAAWVRRFTETSAGKSLLRVMVRQFLDRGIQCLFEGLEEDSQVAFCKEIGVRLMQGYALARPEIAPTSFNERFPEDRIVAPPHGLSAEVARSSGSVATVQAAAAPTQFPRHAAVFGRRHR